MADDNTEDLGTFEQARREEAAEVGRFNLAVFGRSGTGKTTLVTATFGQELTPTPAAMPNPLGMDQYIHPDGIVGVYDARVFTMDAAGELALARLQSVVSESRSKPLPEQLHAAWYTVRWNDRGFDNDQAEFVRRLAQVVPTVFVITQVPANIAGQRHQDAVRLSRYVQAQLLPLSPDNTVYLTNARADEFTGSPVHGLQELLTATFAAAPEAARRALAAAQLIDRERKRPASPEIFVALSGPAVAAGVPPLPVGHAVLFLPDDAGVRAA